MGRNDIEELLKKHFDTENLKILGGSGGCISNGCGYDVGTRKIFVKSNSKKGADIMFDGEKESLKALQETNTIRVPEPCFVEKLNNGEYVLVTEYLDMLSLHSYQAKLGEDLAKLHLDNLTKLRTMKKNENRLCTGTNEGIREYGFHLSTCCGFIPLDNTWSADWVEFYSRQRIQNKIDLITKEYGDRELIQLWSELQLKIDVFFKDITAEPSLLHGDLWSGNAAQINDSPVIFDPASFYGHHEFDLAIMKMFGGFNGSCYKAYFSLLPKEKGFEKRHQLYLLFHYLNHWNHFGTGYRSSSISIMKDLVK